MSTWATPKEQKLEAIKRLEMWQDRGLKPSVLNAFKYFSLANISIIHQHSARA